MWSKWKCVKKPSLYYRGECRVNMGFSKNDFEKVDLRIKKITEQTVEQIEIDSEFPQTEPKHQPGSSWSLLPQTALSKVKIPEHRSESLPGESSTRDSARISLHLSTSEF